MNINLTNIPPCSFLSPPIALAPNVWKGMPFVSAGCVFEEKISLNIEQGEKGCRYVCVCVSMCVCPLWLVSSL